jgi:AcrR family transcriptional regulator
VKTRDRILAGALALFNEEGATGLSAVDIASALGISPGHLYYHFRGKAEIAAALFDAWEGELALVLEGALVALSRESAGLADLHTQVLILLEEAHDVRFLFREAGALTKAFPALAPRYRRVIAAQRGAFAAMLEALAERRALKAKPPRIAALARELALGATFRLAELDLEAHPEPPRERIARAADEIMAGVYALQS